MEHHEIARMVDEGCPHDPLDLDPHPPELLPANSGISLSLRIYRNDTDLPQPQALARIGVTRGDADGRTVIFYFEGQGAAVVKLSANAARDLVCGLRSPERK